MGFGVPQLHLSWGACLYPCGECAMLLTVLSGLLCWFVVPSVCNKVLSAPAQVGLEMSHCCKLVPLVTPIGGLARGDGLCPLQPRQCGLCSAGCWVCPFVNKCACGLVWFSLVCCGGLVCIHVVKVTCRSCACGALLLHAQKGFGGVRTPGLSVESTAWLGLSVGWVNMFDLWQVHYTVRCSWHMQRHSLHRLPIS